MSFTAFQVVDESDLNGLAATDDTSFTPELLATVTNPDLGTGATQDGHLWFGGKLVHVWFEIIFGTSSSEGVGIYEIPMPGIPFLRSSAMADFMALGQVMVRRDSDGLLRPATAYQFQGRIRMWRPDINIEIFDGTFNPWTTGDSIKGHFAYRRI